MDASSPPLMFRFLVSRVLLCLLPTVTSASVQTVPSPAERPGGHRTDLENFRKEFGGAGVLPDVRFFLFGMGLRAKFIYRDGKLLDATTGAVVREWKISADVILPADYKVALETADGRKLTIREDEEAVWIEEGGARTAIKGMRTALKLPVFAENPHPRVLRVLPQELLVNVTPGRAGTKLLRLSEAVVSRRRYDGARF